MNRKKSYRSATLGDALLKPAYELEKLKTKKLEEKNMELEMLVKRLTTERDKALELAKASGDSTYRLSQDGSRRQGHRPTV